jgi:hypothetical protein
MMEQRWSSIALLVLASAMWSPGAFAQSTPKPDGAQREQQAKVDIIRSDIRAQKTALINQTMQFNDAEMKAFWPVYRDFEAKQTALNDERLKLIASYSDAAAAISDSEADAMAVRVLEFESRRTALKREYYKKLKAALPVKTAVKALALEQQIGLLVDSEVAAKVSLRPIK